MEGILRHHRFRLLLRLAGLLFTLIGGWLLFDRWPSPLVAVAVALGGLWQVASLWRYLDRFNRQIIRFLEAIKYEDFQQSFSVDADLGGSLGALSVAMAEVFHLFKQNRESSEQQYRYLQSIVEHIDIGLLSVHSDGRIDFINRAAKQLLRINHLNGIKDLIQGFNEEFVKIMCGIRHGQKLTVAVEGQKVRFSALVYASSLRFGSDTLTLISLQNIDKVLEEKELQAWQSLIRVLTHEIMNSMTPIASLSDTALGLMDGLKREDKENFADITEALQTIQGRSRGLMDFVNAYRNLTLIPKPSFALVRVEALFSRVADLMKARLTQMNVGMSMVVDPLSLTLTADASLIEQVLLNLMINACDALRGKTDPQIKLLGNLGENGHTLISVSDNGCGIAESARDKIFVPFFSTKETGSGIGLAFSRQVMRLHQGYIELQIDDGPGATFVLTF